MLRTDERLTMSYAAPALHYVLCTLNYWLVNSYVIGPITVGNSFWRIHEQKLPETSGGEPWLGVVLAAGIVVESVDCVVAVVGIAVISVVVAVNGCSVVGAIVAANNYQNVRKFN